MIFSNSKQNLSFHAMVFTYQWRIQGNNPRHLPPLTDHNFLNFMQFFFGKHGKFASWCPPGGSVPPPRRILDPPLLVCVDELPCVVDNYSNMYAKEAAMFDLIKITRK